MKLFKSLLLLLVLTFTLPASAFTSPVGVGLFDAGHVHLEFPGSTDNVCGFRFTIFRSVNKNVCGLDIGIFNPASSGDFTGLEVSAGVNTVAGRARVIGLQASILANIDGEISLFGLQFAAVNRVLNAGTIIGAEIGILNIAPKVSVFGLQASAFNHAGSVYGIQLGLVNITDNLHGVQIGVVNMNHNGLIPVTPVVNVGF